VLPLYRDVARAGLEGRGVVRVPLDGRVLTGICHVAHAGQVEVVFIEHPAFFDREFPYGVGSTDYPDNGRRFAFFARAALEYFRTRNERPDLFHAHDWQAGLVPVYLKTHYAHDSVLGGVPSVFTIHNLAYQGVFPLAVLRQAELPPHLGTMDGLEFYGGISYMKGAILFAEIVSTVSPQYAQEIQRPETGYGLDGVLRSRAADLIGILNGVDYDEWDPTHDPHLVSPYSRDDPSGKKACKLDILSEFGLPTHPTLPLLGVVSRLVSQKGFDIVAGAWFDFLARPLRMVVIGTGDRDVKDGLAKLADRDPQRFAMRFVYDPALAHRMMAGIDMLLMPSRYEPCGLTQMYALRYGTAPIVRATGGLVDTVQPFSTATKRGTGFSFEQADGTGLMWAVDQALAVYEDAKGWAKLMQNGMSKDFSWDRSAHAYVSLYREAVRRVPRVTSRAAKRAQAL
jgi:starch synthase